jgi:hypothetical protein
MQLALYTLGRGEFINERGMGTTGVVWEVGIAVEWWGR